jgi:hypothetical protein
MRTWPRTIALAARAAKARSARIASYTPGTPTADMSPALRRARDVLHDVQAQEDAPPLDQVPPGQLEHEPGQPPVAKVPRTHAKCHAIHRYVRPCHMYMLPVRA